MKQWQCGECGAWLCDMWGRHVHMHVSEPTLEDMIAARRLAELHIPTDAPLQTKTESVTTYWRTGKEPTRDKPL
jgi:hypothetical protein